MGVVVRGLAGISRRSGRDGGFSMRSVLMWRDQCAAMSG